MSIVNGTLDRRQQLHRLIPNQAQKTLLRRREESACRGVTCSGNDLYPHHEPRLRMLIDYLNDLPER